MPDDFVCAYCGAPNGDGFNPDYYTPTGDYADPVADARHDLLEVVLAVLDPDVSNTDLIKMARSALAKAGRTAPDSAPPP
jgi:hypothetical protein